MTLAFGLLALTAHADDSVYESGFITAPASGSKSASDQIDLLVLSQLHELKIEHAQKCTDAVFLRRAFLTTIGTLPTEDEARAFLSSKNPNKRQAAVELLLNRPEYVDYWAMKWGDLLRVKAEFPIKLWPNAVQAYHRWILASLKSNKPYDQFVRELLTGNGSNFREGEVNFYRAMQDRSPQGIAATVALTFMGERADKWPEKKLEGMAGFFAHVAFKPTAEWKEEIVFFDPAADDDGLAAAAIFPDGLSAKVDPMQQDPRKLFAAWLIRLENPYFARNIANRVWAWTMGRGIVHEPDDHRSDNPPSNPRLLEFLQREFVANKYDMKHLLRVILNSKVFQMSCIPEQDTPEAAANFAHYPLRRLEAEVLIDALNQITGTTEEYSSPIPEPFTFVPDNVRGIALGDGSITSSFLELFGRPPRDTGLESERSVNNTPQQRLHLLNSSHVQKKIKSCSLVATAGELPEEEMAEKIYLTVLSRLPSKTEVATLKEHAESTSTWGKSLASDLVWALFNQPEFYFNH
jgi:hypothetical protein